MKICQKMWNGWRLPTIFELGNLCYDSTSCSNARTAISLGSYYRSSTEFSRSIARILSMSSGNVQTEAKSVVTHVVCVHD
jgi:hypothetical protein